MNQVVRVRDRADVVASGATGTIVARRRLGDRYAGAIGRVLRVLAPGGYGKTTQVAQWVAAEERPVAWVDLEPIDNDPYVLAAALVQALSEAGGLPAADRAMAPNGTSAAETAVVPRFGGLVGRGEPGFVLVLDDVHNVEADASRALLAALAASLPATSTLILCGRMLRGDWSLGRLRLRPGVVDVTAADLALDRRESAELLASIGVDLGPDELSGLSARVEGWPAGLRLAGSVLQDGGPSTTGPDEAGDAAVVVEYLRAEWTAGLPPAHVQFLREVACLARFDAETCDAVLGRTGSMTLLAHLRRDQQLLVPLDQRDEWFRMPAFLARALTCELKHADPERWRAIHVAAARWWERAGDVDLAVDHAGRAGDVDLREALVGAHGPTYVTRGLSATVGRWCASFPADHVRSSPALCALGAVHALHSGDGARALQWCRLLERLVEVGGRGAFRDDLPALWAGALRATLGTGRAAELIPGAEHAARHLYGGPWHALAHLALGGLRFLADDDRAAESFTAGEFEAELADLPLLQANGIAARGVLAELRGDRVRAAEAGRRAHALLVEHRAEDSPTTALVEAVRALGDARAGDHGAAAAALSAARQKLAGYEGVAPWYNVLARLPLARAALLIDDRAAGRALVGEVDRHLWPEPGGNGARDHVDVLRASVEVAGRAHDAHGTSLTGAELKVLRYLPTNLTIGDIATRLYVSRNTVKTHVSAIHRKLGTASRRDTVGLARRSGLLDDTADLGRD